MSINGVINGEEYLLLVNGKYAIFGTNVSFNVEQSTIDITARETLNWKKVLLKDRSWTMDFEGKLGFTYSDGTINSKHANVYAISTSDIIQDAYMNQQKLTLHIHEMATTGQIYWQGTGRLTGISINTPNEDNSTINLSFVGSGEFQQLTTS
jgi:hypothetical protein